MHYDRVFIVSSVAQGENHESVVVTLRRRRVCKTLFKKRSCQYVTQQNVHSNAPNLAC